MATISFRENAPKFDEPIRFSLGGEDLELAEGKTLESDNPEVLSAAAVHPWLQVEYPVVDVHASMGWDENDPHFNPAADHLTNQATAEVKKAADEREKEIFDAAFPDPDKLYARGPKQEPVPTSQPEVAPEPAVASGVEEAPTIPAAVPATGGNA